MGFSFTLRLLALLLVPLVGLGVLSFQRIQLEQSASASARTLVETARLQQSVADVYGPAQLEQIALAGLAAIDALGVPRDLVVATAGVDFGATYTANVRELDERLDTLANEHGEQAVGEGLTLASRLDGVRREISEQRELSAQGQARQEDVRAVFARLDSCLAEALDPALDPDELDVPTIAVSSVEERAQLSALSAVMVTAGERGRALLDGLLDRTPETTAAIRRAVDRLDFAIERFEALLDEPQPDFNQLIDELQPVPETLLARDDESSSIADEFDPTYIQTSAGAILDQLAFLSALEVFSGDFHHAAVTDLEAEADRATAAARRVEVFAAMIALISLALLLVVVFSTLRPLRRLTRRARDISDGSFDVMPLPERGPKDVRILTGTMNTMTTTLRGVDRGIAALASGSSEEQDRHLPGTIGVSITRSFDRLEAMTARLHASEQLASAIVEQAADAIWTIDEDGYITMANDASVDLVGVDAHDQVGTALANFLPSIDGEVSIDGPTGETARLLVASSAITGGNRKLTTVIARDISERLRFEERLAYQARHDALTGLPNRFAVLDAIASAAANRPLAVLFVDLDGFKSVNDTQGHLAGDRVLTEVGRRLTDHVLPGDFVGRLGGDEFVIVMNGVGQDTEATSFAYRLIRAIEQPYHDNDHLFMLSASIGVATFPRGLGEHRTTPLDAIRRADSAVYAAKQGGRGRVEAFDEQMQAAIVRDAEIELALRSAVRRGELELHLQPVYDTLLDRFTSAEALVRWNRPGFGVVPPNDFIPIAERSSLIDEISRWVLSAACSTLARWAQHGATSGLRIAVNISSTHLLDGGLVSDLDAALMLSRADPRLLDIEITESQLMDDHARAAEILEEIRSRGIKVAIDDFGTGYSSMAYLRQLPIDTLKIDQSFIAPIGSGNIDTTVIDALLTIGHALGLSVVAEGVETAEQLEYVCSRGADRVQGFFLARPMPVGIATTFLSQSPTPRAPRAGTSASGAENAEWV